MKVILSVPDEGYSRKASCTLILMSTFLLKGIEKRQINIKSSFFQSYKQDLKIIYFKYLMNEKNTATETKNQVLNHKSATYGRNKRKCTYQLCEI